MPLKIEWHFLYLFHSNYFLAILKDFEALLSDLDLEVIVIVVVHNTPEIRLSIEIVFFAVVLATLLEETVLPSLSLVVFTSMVTPAEGIVEDIFTAID